MGHWNYRLMAHQTADEIYIEIHEVHYDEKDIPKMYTANAVSIGGENTFEIYWSLQKMLECLYKPILWANDRFPEICLRESLNNSLEGEKALPIESKIIVQLIQIGDSKGLIIPEGLIEKYELDKGFELIDLEEGIFIKPLNINKH